MLAADLDQGDSPAFTLPTRSWLHLNADGSCSFDPLTRPTSIWLRGQTQTLTIPITVTDSAGEQHRKNQTITLTGTNDGATITDHGTPGQIRKPATPCHRRPPQRRRVESGETSSRPNKVRPEWRR
jgi:VCBS repeat-containing protein